MAGVPEVLVKAVMALYVGSHTVVRTGAGNSDSLPVKVGVHQGSVISPLLFDIVMDQVTAAVREGLPWELLYADDLLLLATSREDLLRKLNNWMTCLASKGLKVNPTKTKVMVCSGSTTTQSSGAARWPCGVCGGGVGVSSILCTRCGKWIHKRCSGLSRSLPARNQGFLCRACESPDRCVAPTSDHYVVQHHEFEKVQSFCYLGEALSATGGCDLAVTTRIRCAWKKFHELASFLTSRATPLKLKGKVYEACVRSVMSYGSETWAMKTDSRDKLERADNAMIRRLCGTRLSDRRRSADLRQKLGLEKIEEVLRRSRLRWFGHVLRRSEGDWLQKVRELEVEGRRSAGRPRKTWDQTISEDLRALQLDPALAIDRVRWRCEIRKRASYPVGRDQKDGKRQ